MPGAVASRVRFGEALRWGDRLLSESSESSRADAALLLAHVARQTREWIVAHDDELLAPAQLS
ncbi:MAG: hypothetical protein JO104_01360, partial [Candidatus Eremiobacteraeota bacterium]|nr:hypothetical protein [Candidatus Eremiobacteraeota bacterium]